MSDFLGRVGRITEWVVISNLENRAVNAACDKAQDWWKNRKQNKHDSHASSASPIPPPQPSPQTIYPTPSPQYQQQQASYGPPPPPPPPAPLPPSMGYGELLISINHIDGLNQWGPLIVIMECNHQRYQTSLGQLQQQYSFPIYQFDYDQLCIWIQTEYQQQTIAYGNIPIQILLNNNNNWTPQQQRWIPLRDYYNGPAGQLLVNIEYKMNYPSTQQISGPPPPYPYYS